MTIESAQSYIQRMRSDKSFRDAVNELSDNQEKSWAFIKAQGYDFTKDEFRLAQASMHKEYGIEHK